MTRGKGGQRLSQRSLAGRGGKIRRIFVGRTGGLGPGNYNYGKEGGVQEESSSEADGFHGVRSLKIKKVFGGEESDLEKFISGRKKKGSSRGVCRLWDWP